jgi:integrase/recombinase XerD
MKDKKRIIVFDGPYKKLCEKYISYKKSLGYDFGTKTECTIRNMDRFFKSYHMNTPKLTKEMVLSFTAYRKNESLKTQHYRMCLIRQFAIFLVRLGYYAYILPVRFVKIGKTFTPYIFTHNEISKIIKASDNLTIRKQSPYRHLICPVIIRMLYGCGLRISEALSLKISNVNLQDGILTVTKSKFNKSRLVPMSESLTQVCRDYAAKMNFSIKRDEYFPPAPDKGRYDGNAIYVMFKNLLRHAGIAGTGYSKGFRLHDLRHTFAVHALEKMVEQGSDIYCSLPILCTYLGHTGIESTQKYLRLTTQSFSRITNPLENLYKGVFPEVNTNEK